MKSITNTEILKKAIEKAYPDTKLQEEGYLLGYAKGQIERDEGYRLIFSHGFAKAFWGEGYTPVDYRHGIPVLSKLLDFQYHLQNMVLEKHPLKYLKKFL